MSPSPGLRNRGQTLAEHVSAKPHNENIADTRDRIVAHRNRQAAGWESAASTLEARAQRVRVNSERAHHLELFSEDVRCGAATAPRFPPEPGSVSPSQPRYYLGACLACEREVWVHTQKPRVPMCEQCRGRG